MADTVRGTTKWQHWGWPFSLSIKARDAAPMDGWNMDGWLWGQLGCKAIKDPNISCSKLFGGRVGHKWNYKPYSDISESVWGWDCQPCFLLCAHRAISLYVTILITYDGRMCQSLFLEWWLARVHCMERQNCALCRCYSAHVLSLHNRACCCTPALTGRTYFSKLWFHFVIGYSDHLCWLCKLNAQI